MAITLNDAKTLEHGTILYHVENKNADGTPQRWRVNGNPKTWKTRPNEVSVPMAYGLKTYDRLTEHELSLVCLYKWEATGKKLSFKREVLERETYYNVCLDKDTYGIVFKRDGLWYNTRVDRDKGFRTRLEVAKHLLNCVYS